MGGKESTHIDSLYFENVSFHLNILVCGDYSEMSIENELENVKNIDSFKGLPYIKVGTHKNLNDWKYYFFAKDENIGENTFKLINESVLAKDIQNVILFYSGLNIFTYKKLIEFYDKKPESYHPNIIIITKNDETFSLPKLNRIRPNLIRNVVEKDDINIYINLIEVSSYVNQLGDEIGFPKNIIKEGLLEKDNELMIKYSFTFNILVCGKPGVGKSTFINRIMGEEKCFSGKGTSSLTQRVVKYISSKYPILIYDTPGFEKPEDIIRIQKLIEDKNKTLNEEKNRIHCVLYLMNIKAERTFIEKEYDFLLNLLNQKMDVFFVATHAGTKENSEDYIEAAKINLEQNSGTDKRIGNLKQYIYPVELQDDEFYKKFGIKELFTALYNKYKDYKYQYEISSYNLKEIKSIFIKELTSKEKVKIKLTALSRRVKANFKLLASTLENSPFVKTTSISNAVIKIISKIYNHPMSTEKCLEFIEKNDYTNELKNSDTIERNIQKTIAWVFYKNGPAAKQVDYLAESLIKIFNQELNYDKEFYEFLNSYNKSINYAIDCLKEIKD